MSQQTKDIAIGSEGRFRYNESTKEIEVKQAHLQGFCHTRKYWYNNFIHFLIEENMTYGKHRYHWLWLLGDEYRPKFCRGH